MVHSVSSSSKDLESLSFRIRYSSQTTPSHHPLTLILAGLARVWLRDDFFLWVSLLQIPVPSSSVGPASRLDSPQHMLSSTPG